MIDYTKYKSYQLEVGLKELKMLINQNVSLKSSKGGNERTKIEIKINELTEIYNKIINILIKRNLPIESEYFDYSSFENFKTRLPELEIRFKKAYSDSTLFEFYKDLVIGYSNDYVSFLSGHDLIFRDILSKIEYSRLRKVEYLNELLANNTKAEDKNREKPSKEAPFNAPAKRLFCELVTDSGLIIRGEESAERFCSRICEQYNLTYTSNVRKYFYQGKDLKKTDKNLKTVMESILPTIPQKDQEVIRTYITNQIEIIH